jgi:diguanylate cyclase (GGDEF)-like protein
VPHSELPRLKNWMSRSSFVAVLPFVLILALLVGISVWALRLQDASRIYLAGENYFDAGENRAVLCLLNYAETHAEADLRCFRSEIDVVLGDRQARMALDSPNGSLAVIYDGFLRGRNRHQDISRAITFYRLAHWNREMEQAIAAWRETDAPALRLVEIADALQRSTSPAENRILRREIFEIDEVLSAKERLFAEHLNNGMRLLSLALVAAQTMTAVVLISLAIFVSRRLNAARESAQEQVRRLAYYDPLTSLPNRSLLAQRLDTALENARVSGLKVAVIFLDLDRFKIINDSLGHSIGDLLLQEVAQRLRQHVRGHDTVARLGGDEFLIILTSLNSIAEATATADRIRKALTGDFSNRGHRLNISASIGISLFPEHGADGETLIKNADAAMYCAKEEGPNLVRVFADEMNVAVVERLTLENSLRLALERGEFFLVYQPQMEIRTGRIVGLEALLRWKHPELGLVPPATFIRVAEHSGLILPIGQWVLTEACAQARVWLEQGLLDFPIAVNVSAAQFRHEEFCAAIHTALAHTALPSRFLELELTESLLLSNADMMFPVLEELESMGVRLAIDDFGTGYSSLSYLRHLPVKKLKVDRSFIEDIGLDTDDAAITRAIISMARSLNLRVVAEGVESADQLAFLGMQRCDDIQGYYFSRPLPASAMSQFLEAARGSAQAAPEPNRTESNLQPVD